MSEKGIGSKTVIFLGGATLAGVLGIIGVLLGIIQIGQTERDAKKDERTNATLVANQVEQLENLKEIKDLQSRDFADDYVAATSAAQQVVQLESTVEALEQEGLAIEATSTANAVVAQSSAALSLLCQGKEPLIFLDGLPENDPCDIRVADGIVQGAWVVVEPRTDSGWQTGKCLYRYSNGDRNGIYEGSMWALFRGNSEDNDLPTCPQTK